MLILAALLHLARARHVYLAVDAHNTARPLDDGTPVSPECEAAVAAARLYRVHIHDLDNNGRITIDDIGPAAIRFGLHWLDVAPRDGALSLAELQDAWSLKASWWLKTASWVTSFLTSKYTPEQVFADCASHHTPTLITMEDYMARRATTCMETCGKAEDVFNFLGAHFGDIE
jgi:hypothetical protein